MQDVCIVVPCFNEARRLPRQAIVDFLEAQPGLSVCLVNDGSLDATGEVLDALARERPAQVSAHHLPRNSGKAEAVRQGVLRAGAAGRFAFVGFWDADLSTPLTELVRLMEVFETSPQCQLAMGSRVKRLGSDIDRRVVRHYLGRVFATAASLILDLPVYDSQCGAKVFRAATAAALFREPFISAWLFDVELLARLRNLLGRSGALAAAVEVPLGAWHDAGGSKLRPIHLARVPLELLAIQSRYRPRDETRR